MIPLLRLPLAFDPAQLQRDLERVPAATWMAHFNTQVYEGDWSGVALRSVRGAALQLYPDPTATGNFADTDLLAGCPYFKHVLATFHCELESVRLLKLRAGSVIREHRDYRLALEDGVLRIHVPITTNPGVEFYLSGETVVMQPGEAWYLNFNLPHRVENHGDTDRVHLVIDGVVNDWVQDLFATAAA